jgi:hypothetical protein
MCQMVCILASRSHPISKLDQRLRMPGTGIVIQPRVETRYLFSVSEAAPVLCRGGARYTATIRNCRRAPPPVPSLPSPGAPGLGREGTGGGARRQLRIVAVYRAPPRHKTGAASETLNRYPGLPGLARGSIGETLPIIQYLIDYRASDSLQSPQA